jgi:tetratricopeptide (TPR) repeat protein
MALCGVFAFAVMASFNFPSERPASVLLLSLFVVLAAGKPTTAGAVSAQKRKNDALGKGLAAMLGIVSLAFALLNIQIVRSDIQALKISFAKQAQNWYAVHEAAKKADRWYYPIHSMNGTPIPWYQGTALLLRGESARALPFLQRAYDIHPWHPHVVSNYGSVLFGTGKQEETVKMWEDMLAIFPEFHEVRVNLNEIYFMRSRWDKVEENLTFWENSAKPRNISLYLTQVKARMDSVRIRFNQ